jgi:ABC-2 type transport system permease protein
MSERRRPNLVVAYSRLAVVELVRLPAFVAPTLAFPPLLFLFFGAPRAKGADAAWAISASFAAFAVLGVLLFQFGVGIADERDSPWERYVRTLRAPPWVRFAGRITAALVFSVASLAPLAVVAAMTTDVSPSLGAFGSVLVAVLVGSVPFGLFGIAMGYWVHPKGALAVTNLIYLPLAYLGGLFQGEEALPDAVSRWSAWLPTRTWNQVVQDAAFARPELDAWLGLAAWAAVFFGAAWLGYRRDQGRNYR